MKRFADGFRQLGDEYKTRHKGLLSRIQHLYNIMPFVAPPPTDSYQGQFHLCFKRFLPFALARGIFGTFMGLYNQYQYGQLQKELDKTIDEQQRLVTWSHKVENKLGKFNATLEDLCSFVRNTQLISPVYVGTKLMHGMWQWLQLILLFQIQPDSP